MKRKISASPAALVREIEKLQAATSANLKERWRALYRSEPPRRISRDLLIRALAYRIQKKALGGRSRCLGLSHAPNRRKVKVLHRHTLRS